MKYFFSFILYFALGIFIFASYKETVKIIDSQKLNSPIAEISFSLNSAPSESLKGKIAFLSGDVEWQSRIATGASKIIDNVQIQQGEDVIVKENGKASIVISAVLKIDMKENSHVNLVQTLPENILIEQKTGDVSYENLNNGQITVRIGRLIVKINNGKIRVAANGETPYITVDVDKNATAAFNDSAFVSRLLNISGNKRLLFNKESKTARIISI